MEQTQQKEQKWGFWLYMLNFFSLDSISLLLIRRIMPSGRTPFSYHTLSSFIAITLTIGITYLFRHHPWKFKVWITAAIIAIWLLAHIFSTHLPL
jgi:hypothetical protein